MGIWNAHTSLGNILGGLIASAFLKEYYVERGYWFWSFFYPALIIFGMAVIVFFFLVPRKFGTFLRKNKIVFTFVCPCLIKCSDSVSGRVYDITNSTGFANLSAQVYQCLY